MTRSWDTANLRLIVQPPGLIQLAIYVFFKNSWIRIATKIIHLVLGLPLPLQKFRQNSFETFK